MDRTHRCGKGDAGAHGAGTNACYTLCSCRCYPCSTAGTDYRRRLYLANQWSQSLTVDAEPVRQHVRALMCRGKRGTHHNGVGLKQIVKVSGVSQGALWKLMYGASDRPGPSRKVRRSTAEKLLAVTKADMADSATVPAGPTRRKLDAMVTGGFAKAELGRYLTGDARTKSLQVGQSGRVTVANRRQVDELYRRWKAGEIAPYGRWCRGWGDPPVVPRETGLHLAQGERRKGVVIRHECEDCGSPTLAGGRWCWPCFRNHSHAREVAS